MGVFLVPIVGFLGLLTSYYLAVGVLKADPGSSSMKKISDLIHQGALIFLKKEYFILSFVVIIFFLLISIFNDILVGTAFLIGSIFSVLSGFIGMNIATRANTRTTQAAKTSLGKALNIAFSGGAVMGLIVASLGILGSFFVFYGSYYLTGDFIKALNVATGYSMGASLVALFARVGGGIYTKAADVGADLVGKIEAGIPEDDPRNPAVIADNVGDNVGDIAGMGADLFESYVGAILAAIILGFSSILSKNGDSLGVIGVNFVYLIVASGLFSSIFGVIFVKILSKFNKFSPEILLRYSSIGAAIIFGIFSFLISYFYLNNLKTFVPIISGVIVGVVIGLVTEYYTGMKPIEEIADSSKGGPATNILSGLAVGMESIVIPVILIGAGIIISFVASGIFGVALAGVGMLATLGITLSVDAYGPIADNAGGIAEMSKQEHYVRERTDKLDKLGNTTAAMGKGFAIGSAALTALALFSTYAHSVKINIINILDPKIIVGIFIGSILPFWFSAMLIKAVGRTANVMVEEVRRQFKEIPGLLRGEAEADPSKCVEISTRGALKNMIQPAIIMIIAPFLTYFLIGKEGVGGLLLGATISGVTLAIFMANAGGAWDNAKKLIESKKGGKGSFAHQASIIGDTVGDPLKDTAGPSLNILIKLMSIISISFIPLFLR